MRMRHKAPDKNISWLFGFIGSTEDYYRLFSKVFAAKMV